MTELITNFFSTVFGDNVELATIIIAIIPIIELRGAIPFATNANFWGSNTLNQWAALAWSLLGSCAVVFLLAAIFLPIINWLKKTKLFGKLALAIENRIRSKSESIEGANEKSKRFSKTYWKKVIATFIFVAIPLPLTGVWTGTCLAVFIGLDYWTTCITVIGGNVVAGVFISLILEFFPWLNNYLFYIFMILVLVFILYEIASHFIKKRKAATADLEDNK